MLCSSIAYHSPLSLTLESNSCLRLLFFNSLVPTTAGTGSETTGTAIFDYKPLNVKTGIASRKLRPTLGIVDPLNTLTMPTQVKIASGLDVLCHALESYTALPYQERTPRPKNPAERPAYQGSNPISDIWSLEALRLTVKYLKRSADDPLDLEANAEMCLAAAAAGTGFGSAGVHVRKEIRKCWVDLIKFYGSKLLTHTSCCSF